MSSWDRLRYPIEDKILQHSSVKCRHNRLRKGCFKLEIPKIVIATVPSAALRKFVIFSSLRCLGCPPKNLKMPIEKLKIARDQTFVRLALKSTSSFPFAKPFPAPHHQQLTLPSRSPQHKRKHGARSRRLSEETEEEVVEGKG